MLGKLLTIILSLGLMGAALLEARQRHINLVYEMTVSHQRIMRQERSLWELRRAIAVRCRPDEIRRLLEEEDPARWRVITVPNEPVESPPLNEARAPLPRTPFGVPRLLIGPLALTDAPSGAPPPIPLDDSTQRAADGTANGDLAIGDASGDVFGGGR